jgi:hypothetical protein
VLCNRITPSLGFALALVIAGCGGSHTLAAESSRKAVGGDAFREFRQVASVCKTAAYALNTIYQHTVGQSSPGEFKYFLQKLVEQSGRVLATASHKLRKAKVAPRLMPRVSEYLANLGRGRKVLDGLSRMVSHVHGSNYGAFPPRTLKRLIPVGLACGRRTRLIIR